MFKNILALFVFCLSVALAVWKFPALFPAVDVQIFNNDWFHLAHGSHNAFVQFHYAPFLVDFAKLLQKLNGNLDLANCYNLLCLFLGIWSTFVLCLQLNSLRRLAALLISFAWGVILIRAWGADTVLLATMALFPSFIASVYKYAVTERYKNLFFLISLFLAVAFTYTANQIALLFSIFGIVLALGLAGRSAKNNKTVLLILLIPSFILLLNAPAPNIPRYPKYAEVHLVNDFGVPGELNPSSSAETPLIDRSFIKNTYAKAVFLLLFMVISGFLTFKKTPRFLFFCSILLTCLLAIDIFCPEGINRYMPIALLNSLIPPYSFFALTPLLTALAFFIVLIQAHTAHITSPLVLFLSFLLFFPQKMPVFQAKSANRALLEYNESVKLNPAIKRYKKYLVSPSLHLLNDYGMWIVTTNQNIRLQDVIKIDPQVEFSDYKNSSTEEFDVLKDRKWKTRWHATQQGNEWIMVKFSEPQTLRIIEPTPSKKLLANYARGIEISASNDCKNFKNVVKMPEWQGEIKFTTKGYPYYAYHYHMIIRFKDSVTARCWRLQRLGETTDSAWSIAKLKVGLVKSNKKNRSQTSGVLIHSAL